MGGGGVLNGAVVIGQLFNMCCLMLQFNPNSGPMDHYKRNGLGFFWLLVR